MWVGAKDCILNRLKSYLICGLYLMQVISLHTPQTQESSGRLQDCRSTRQVQHCSVAVREAIVNDKYMYIIYIYVMNNIH